MKRPLILSVAIICLFLSSIFGVTTLADNYKAYERKWEENNPDFSVETDSYDYVLNYGTVWQYNDKNEPRIAIGEYNPEFYSDGDKINILMVNGGTVPGAKIVIKDGVTLVPVRIVSEILGFNVNWNAQERAIDVSTNGKKLNLILDSSAATLDGKRLTLSTPARIINGSTYVPLRFIGECFGLKVGYTPFHFASHTSAEYNIVYFVTVDDFKGENVLDNNDCLQKVKNSVKIQLEQLLSDGFISDKNEIQKSINSIRYVEDIGRYRGYVMDDKIEILINTCTGDVMYNITYSLLVAAFWDSFGIYYQ